MSSRTELQKILEGLLGSRNVYFQPPASVKMQFPCIRYRLKNIQTKHANNKVYSMFNCYELVYIDSNPDSEMVRSLASLVMCTLDRHYQADNLNHYVYTLYF